MMQYSHQLRTLVRCLSQLTFVRPFEELHGRTGGTAGGGVSGGGGSGGTELNGGGEIGCGGRCRGDCGGDWSEGRGFAGGLGALAVV